MPKARRDEGRTHSPSPQIKPEAIAGIIKLAFAVLSLCNKHTFKVPTQRSMAQLDMQVFNAEIYNRE